MATATIDVRVLGAGFAAKVMRRGMTTALDEVERRIARERAAWDERADKDGLHPALFDGIDACAAIVATARADAESAPLPEDEAPTAAQWLDAPTGDGLWWRCEKGSAYVEAVSVRFDHVGGYRVAFVGDLRSEYRHPDCSEGMPVYGWLRVDVPEAPR